MGIRVKQRDVTDCGAACLASIAAYYRLRIPVSRIRQMAGTDKKGTNVLGLIQAGEKMGMSAKGVWGKQESLMRIPLPAIAHVVIGERLHHYVVIYKVTPKWLQIMDPRHGKTERMPIKEFMNIWSKAMVLMAPNEDFRPANLKASNRSRFLFLLKPHRGILMQALFGAVIYTILGLSTSIYIQKITDHVLVGGNRNLLNLLSIAMVMILLFQIFIGIIKTIFILKTGQKIDVRLILGYYKHLLKLPQRFFDTMRVGELISRINDAVKIRQFINDTMITLVVNLFIIVFAFGLMFIYSWKLALIIALILPLYGVVYAITNRLNKKQERRVMVNAAEVESQLVESLNAVRTIKQFGLEDFANLRTETRFVALLRSVYHSGLNAVFSGNTSAFLSRGFTIILLWVGSYFVINRLITPGELLSFYALMGYFTGPAMALVGMNKTMQNAMIAGDRLFEIMDLEREEQTPLMELDKEMVGDVHMENVWFSYGNRTDVFEGINLTFKKGKITAVIGESGSGKSTITYLLQKLYPLNKGGIRIGQYDLGVVSNKSLRRIIGVVPQQLNIFSGTVADNIAIGDPDPDMKRLVGTCSRLGMLDFIKKMPNGFGTWLGANGASLSGGQKQRIAIARALYRCPRILILDEALSSLDSEAEAYVQKVLNDLRNRGLTVVMITHRLSSLALADWVVVLDKGKVAEQGSPRDLYHHGGKYYGMWQKQLPAFYN